MAHRLEAAFDTRQTGRPLSKGWAVSFNEAWANRPPPGGRHDRRVPAGTSGGEPDTPRSSLPSCRLTLLSMLPS